MKEELERRENKQDQKLKEYKRKLAEIKDEENERKLASKIKDRYRNYIKQAQKNKLEIWEKSREIEETIKVKNKPVGLPVSSTEPAQVPSPVPAPEPTQVPTQAPAPAPASAPKIDSELCELCKRKAQRTSRTNSYI